MQIALGDWDRHDFRQTTDPVLANVLFLTYILIMAVVLLNLLIAIMGDSFDRVKDKEVLEFLRGKVISQFALGRSASGVVHLLDLTSGCVADARRGFAR